MLTPKTRHPGSARPAGPVIFRPLIYLAALCFSFAATAWAGVSAPERLLPPDTLVFLASPSSDIAVRTLTNVPSLRLWSDPAMRPFMDHFKARWREEFVLPLERDLHFRLADYAFLMDGQVTLALTKNPSAKGGRDRFGWLLTIDCGNRAEQLKTNLALLHKRWTESGRPVRMEKTRGLDFLVTSFGTNALPAALRAFLPEPLEYHELGETEQPKPAPSEIVLGLAGTTFVLANSMGVADQFVARLGGAGLPTLAEQASFTPAHQRAARDSGLFGWVNTRVLLQGIARSAAERKENPQAPNPMESLRLEKVLAASGLMNVNSLGFGLRTVEGGLLLETRFSAPESTRGGIVRILAGETKEVAAPSFVPADVATFRRWRIDGQKAWAGFERMLGEVSREAVNVLNFIFETANLAARDKQPGFDVRKNLIGNLGDDVITYAKPAPVAGPAQRLWLISSPRPEELAAAMKNILVFVTAQAGSPNQREFLGRTIFSVTLPSLPIPIPGAPPPPPVPRTLHYAAGSSYVGFSTDARILEEFLRAQGNPGKSLGEKPGLREAAAAAGASSMFSYEDQVAAMRARYERLRASASSTNKFEVLPNIPGMARPERELSDLMNPNLLPPFSRVAQYLSFTAGGLSTDVEGLTWRIYMPLPRIAPQPAPAAEPPRQPAATNSPATNPPAAGK